MRTKQLPINSDQSLADHPAILEAAAVILSMRHALIPPTDGLETFDPELPKIDVVMGAPREWKPGPSLSNSFGFGGHNGTLVIAPA